MELLTLLKKAADSKASDLHLSVGAVPMMRIRGKLEMIEGYDILMPEDAEALLLPLLDTLARSELNSKGQYDMSYKTEFARYRVNIFKQKGDLAGVFRVLSESVPNYQTLGLPTALFNLYRKRRGLILIVGPTGSGKSTTLASFLDIINRQSQKHIITLEDPIEYMHWHSSGLINQREIGKDCVSFATGLRAALREDPDVILIGEMRDFETTEIALTAAETGHLVCSTLHTLGAADTLNRVVAMYPTRQQELARSQLTSILEAVVSQQLLPKADKSGYCVAFEILFRDDYVKKLIARNDLDAISEYLWTEDAMNRGMCAMDYTIEQLYRKGTITKQTALDYAFNRDKMEAKLGSL